MSFKIWSQHKVYDIQCTCLWCMKWYKVCKYDVGFMKLWNFHMKSSFKHFHSFQMEYLKYSNKIERTKLNEQKKKGITLYIHIKYQVPTEHSKYSMVVRKTERKY